ncbi:MAG: hypothetical protein P8N19_04330 [Flavobacteriales bacterium]|nr:hypothetical protein [Flavobacteriales bacterium]
MRELLSILFACLLITATTAQGVDSTATDDFNVDSSTTSTAVPALKLKPRVGLGIGPMVFIGDVGSGNKANHLGAGKMALTLDVSNRLNSFLDVRLYSTFGKVQITDYAGDTPFEFKSTLRNGGVSLTYNFDHFLKPNRSIEPWVSVGFESIEFLSKADLKDANGFDYHYWNDGRIMNMDQNGANADEAIQIYKDGVYETDLREMNLDGRGRYAERTWGIPVGAGFQFLLSDRFQVRCGTQMTFGMSDLIDNRTADSDGPRKGNAANDRFLYSSVALNYDLSIRPKVRELPPMEFMDENGEMMLVSLSNDGDNDGVNDMDDECAGTPEGAPVDSKGCPTDSDGDGYADYMDDEPNSAHMNVDAFGVAMSDEDTYQRYLMWNDSIPWKTSTWSENYAKLNSDPGHWSNRYSVQVGAQSEGLSQSQINAILSLKDITMITENNDQIYVAGNFENLPDAVKRKIELSNNGIQGSVVSKDGEEPLVNVGEEAIVLENSMREEMRVEELELLAAMPIENALETVNVNDPDSAMLAIENAIEAVGANEEGFVFRVQVGAFRGTLNEDIFAGINDIISLTGQDQLTRYMTSSYSSLEEAAERRVKLLTQGFEGSFIAAFKDGERVTLASAGAKVLRPENDITYDLENNSIDPSFVTFKVQLGAFDLEIPTATLDSFLELGGISSDKNKDGLTRYFSLSVDSYESAEMLMNQALDLGIEEAFIVADFNGTTITVGEALSMRGEVAPVTASQD